MKKSKKNKRNKSSKKEFHVFDKLKEFAEKEKSQLKAAASSIKNKSKKNKLVKETPKKESSSNNASIFYRIKGFFTKDMEEKKAIAEASKALEIEKKAEDISGRAKSLTKKHANHKGVLNPVTINEYMDRSVQEVLDSLEDDKESFSKDDISLLEDYEDNYQKRAEVMTAIRLLKRSQKKQNPSFIDKIKSKMAVSGFKNPFSEKLGQIKDKIERKKTAKKILSEAEKAKIEKDKRKQEIRKRLDLKTVREIRERKAKKYQGKRYKLKDYLQKAGIAAESKIVAKRLFDLCVLINLVLSIYVIYYFSVNYNYTLYYAIINMAILWTVIFAGLLVLIWMSFHIMLDLRIFHRKVSIEVVLPDFLQLTSANIRAGMPIDQSLWYAVRPRFGILSKEIEIVAKETMSGKDLKDALISFTDKYNSKILKRSFNLLIEGMEAGGEVGDLLNKISINISEANILKKEMAANVTTYVIFIGFATLVAAPFLFALSAQLLKIMTSLSSNVSVPSGSLISFSGTSITSIDFLYYSLASLITTAFFSSLIVAIIKKGNIKEGIGYIPRFIGVVVTLYFIATWILDKVFANLV